MLNTTNIWLSGLLLAAAASANVETCPADMGTVTVTVNAGTVTVTATAGGLESHLPLPLQGHTVQYTNGTGTTAPTVHVPTGPFPTGISTGTSTPSIVAPRPFGAPMIPGSKSYMNGLSSSNGQSSGKKEASSSGSSSSNGAPSENENGSNNGQSSSNGGTPGNGASTGNGHSFSNGASSGGESGSSKGHSSSSGNGPGYEHSSGSGGNGGSSGHGESNGGSSGHGSSGHGGTSGNGTYHHHSVSPSHSPSLANTQSGLPASGTGSPTSVVLPSGTAHSNGLYPSSEMGHFPSATGSPLSITASGTAYSHYSYPSSGTRSPASSGGYYPSGSGSPSGSGYFPSGTGSPSGYPSRSGYLPSGYPSSTGTGSIPSRTPINPSGSGYFPPSNGPTGASSSYGTGMYPSGTGSPTSYGTGKPIYPGTTAMTSALYPTSTGGGCEPNIFGGCGPITQIPSALLETYPTGYGPYHWDKSGHVESKGAAASVPLFALIVGSILSVLLLV